LPCKPGRNGKPPVSFLPEIFFTFDSVLPLSDPSHSLSIRQFAVAVSRTLTQRVLLPHRVLFAQHEQITGSIGETGQEE
jgi:hypothetical protein